MKPFASLKAVDVVTTFCGIIISLVDVVIAAGAVIIAACIMAARGVIAAKVELGERARLAKRRLDEVQALQVIRCAVLPALAS